MTLERIDLEMDAIMRKELHSWAEEGCLPEHKSAELTAIVQNISLRKKTAWRKQVLGVAIAAFLVVFIVAASPTVRSWAVENLSLVGDYIGKWSNLEKGWQWADENNMFQEVIAVKSDQGYTFRVHKVLADPTQTTVIYTVEGENPQHPLSGMEIRFDGARITGGMGGRGDIGNVTNGVLVGSFELSGGLPKQSGIMELIIRRLGDVQGDWSVSFPVTSAPLDELTRIVEVNKDMEVANGMLTVEQLVLAPTQTVVKLRYKGEGQRPDLIDINSIWMLITPTEIIESRGVSGSGELVDNRWEQTYELRFQRLDVIPETVTLKLSGRIYRQGETRVMFDSSQTAIAPDGRKIYYDNLVEEGGKGKVTILFSTDEHNPWPFDISGWKILDDKGGLHRTTPGSGSQTVSAAKNTDLNNPTVSQTYSSSTTLNWRLPDDRKAIAAINTGYWEFIDDLDSITIRIPND